MTNASQTKFGPLAGKKIILTGGAGFLGRQVQRVLLQRGVREEDI